MSNESKKTVEKEVIVPLNEDAKSHTHNDPTYERMLRQQEEARRKMNENK